MIGTWRWNAALGFCGALLTLLFSLDGNGLHITGIRCLYAFLAFYALAFPFRAGLTAILRPRPLVPAETDEDASPNPQAGANVDLATPDENRELHDLLRDPRAGSADVSVDSGFTHLSPPKLVSTQNKDPEQLAQAIRHLTGG